MNFEDQPDEIIREQLMYMDDKDVLKMCKLNKRFYYEICNDDFWHLRFMNRFPKKISNEKGSWKEKYFTEVKIQKNFENLMNAIRKPLSSKEFDYGFIYFEKDGSQLSLEKSSNGYKIDYLPDVNKDDSFIEWTKTNNKAEEILSIIRDVFKNKKAKESHILLDDKSSKGDTIIDVYENYASSAL